MVAEKNISFAWEGVNRKGAHVKGEHTAVNSAEVKAKLLQQGIKVSSVHKKSSLVSLLSFSIGSMVKPEDIMLFCRQLSTMISANTPLLQALDIILQGEKKAGLQNILHEVRNDIAEGISLSESLRKHPKQFDSLFCNLVAVGEQSGTLDKLLEKIAAYKEQMESIRKKIKKALFYPVTIVSIAVIVVTVMLVFVVPRFQELFSSFGHDLPAFTQAVVSASRTMRHYWWMYVVLIPVIISSYTYIKKRVKAIDYFVEKLKLKIFIFGPILRKAVIARVTRTLSISLAAGVPLVEALGSIAAIAGNKIYRDSIIKVRDEVAAGQSLDFSMQATNLFPALVVKMIVVGEQSGRLEEVLGKVAVFYEEDISHAIDILSSLIEPLVMVILGVIIGGFVAAMYLPIFRLGSIF